MDHSSSQLKKYSAHEIREYLKRIEKKYKSEYKKTNTVKAKNSHLTLKKFFQQLKKKRYKMLKSVWEIKKKGNRNSKRL